MDQTDLCYLPATEAARLIRDKRLSPVDLMEAVLARVETLEPRLNAFAYVAAESAMLQARAAEQSVTDGESVGPLHGVPVTIKDLSDTRDMPTQRGSNIFAEATSDFDSPFVTRLAAAGAIAIGKTTTPEFGWKGVSESPLTGITHNPWAAGQNAGASSAGAGVGAAAGYGPLHQGSDGAGSVRMPSHFCGIFGLKPSYGRVANWPINNNDQTSHIGPMTRTVADAGLMLHAMAGPDLLDHYSLEGDPPDYAGELHANLDGLRVAFSPDLGHARVDQEVAAVVRDAVATFESLGARVEEITPDWGPDGPEIIRFFWPVHELAYAQYLPEWESRMDPGLVACIRAASGTTAEAYLAMRQRKLDYVADIHRWFEDWDLLLTPAVSVVAVPAEQLQPEHWPEHPWDWLTWAEFSYPFNMSHNPAASVPAGFTAAGLPVGLQLVGRRLDDLGVLQAAAALEEARPWAQHRPQL